MLLSVISDPTITEHKGAGMAFATDASERDEVTIHAIANAPGWSASEPVKATFNRCAAPVTKWFQTPRNHAQQNHVTLTISCDPKSEDKYDVSTEVFFCSTNLSAAANTFEGHDGGSGWERCKPETESQIIPSDDKNNPRTIISHDTKQSGWWIEVDKNHNRYYCKDVLYDEQTMGHVFVCRPDRLPFQCNTQFELSSSGGLEDKLAWITKIEDKNGDRVHHCEFRDIVTRPEEFFAEEIRPAVMLTSPPPGYQYAVGQNVRIGVSTADGDQCKKPIIKNIKNGEFKLKSPDRNYRIYYTTDPTIDLVAITLSAERRDAACARGQIKIFEPAKTVDKDVTITIAKITRVFRAVSCKNKCTNSVELQWFVNKAKTGEAKVCDVAKVRIDAIQGHIHMTCSDKSAKMYWTIDGSVPQPSFGGPPQPPIRLYSPQDDPRSIYELAFSETECTTVKAVAISDYTSPSKVMEVSKTLERCQVPDVRPVLEYGDAKRAENAFPMWNGEIEFKCQTPGAAFAYTISCDHCATCFAHRNQVSFERQRKIIDEWQLMLADDGDETAVGVHARKDKVQSWQDALPVEERRFTLTLTTDSDNNLVPRAKDEDGACAHGTVFYVASPSDAGAVAKTGSKEREAAGGWVRAKSGDNAPNSVVDATRPGTTFISVFASNPGLLNSRTVTYKHQQRSACNLEVSWGLVSDDHFERVLGRLPHFHETPYEFHIDSTVAANDAELSGCQFVLRHDATQTADVRAGGADWDIRPTVTSSEQAQVDQVASRGFAADRSLYAYLESGKRVEQAIELLLKGRVPTSPYRGLEREDEVLDEHDSDLLPEIATCDSLHTAEAEFLHTTAPTYASAIAKSRPDSTQADIQRRGSRPARHGGEVWSLTQQIIYVAYKCASDTAGFNNVLNLAKRYQRLSWTDPQDKEPRKYDERIGTVDAKAWWEDVHRTTDDAYADEKGFACNWDYDPDANMYLESSTVTGSHQGLATMLKRRFDKVKKAPGQICFVEAVMGMDYNVLNPLKLRAFELGIMSVRNKAASEKIAALFNDSTTNNSVAEELDAFLLFRMEQKVFASRAVVAELVGTTEVDAQSACDRPFTVFNNLRKPVFPWPENPYMPWPNANSQALSHQDDNPAPGTKTSGGNTPVCIHNDHVVHVLPDHFKEQEDAALEERDFQDNLIAFVGALGKTRSDTLQHVKGGATRGSMKRKPPPKQPLALAKFNVSLEAAKEFLSGPQLDKVWSVDALRQLLENAGLIRAAASPTELLRADVATTLFETFSIRLNNNANKQTTVPTCSAKQVLEMWDKLDPLSPLQFERVMRWQKAVVQRVLFTVGVNETGTNLVKPSPVARDICTTHLSYSFMDTYSDHLVKTSQAGIDFLEKLPDSNGYTECRCAEMAFGEKLSIEGSGGLVGPSVPGHSDRVGVHASGGLNGTHSVPGQSGRVGVHMGLHAALACTDCTSQWKEHSRLCENHSVHEALYAIRECLDCAKTVQDSNDTLFLGHPRAEEQRQRLCPKHEHRTDKRTPEGPQDHSGRGPSPDRKKTFLYSNERGRQPWVKQHTASIYTLSATNFIRGMCPSESDSQVFTVTETLGTGDEYSYSVQRVKVARDEGLVEFGQIGLPASQADLAKAEKNKWAKIKQSLVEQNKPDTQQFLGEAT